MLDQQTRLFICEENIKRFKALLESATEDAERETLHRLLAEQEVERASAVHSAYSGMSSNER